MADVFYGMDRGDTLVDVVRAGASPTKGVELVIDDAVSLTRTEVLLALDYFKQAIIRNDGPF